MHEIFQFKQTRRLLFIIGIGTACLVSVVCLAVPNGGPWTESRHKDGCPQGKVCADWEIGEGEVWASCCIDPSELGSSNLGACEENFRHYHNSI